MQDIRGQCYNGAANMSSRKKGLSGRVLDKNDKAVLTVTAMFLTYQLLQLFG